ncbi:MAG: CBS domain-containing protein [Myxococcales bacterium]|nr:CBS domain-containing protein [Myxococcales bacterium]
MAKPLVGAYMATRYPVLHPDVSLLDAVDVFVKNGILGAPVVDADGRLLGFFSEVDLLRLLAVGADHDVPSGTVADYMVKDVVSISPDVDVYWAAGLMLAQGLSYLPVLQNGAMIGLINRRAILRALKEHFGE